MLGGTTVLWLAWWGAAALSLALFIVIRIRRDRCEPSQRRPAGWAAAYRAPMLLMLAASGVVLLPIAVWEIANDGGGAAKGGSPTVHVIGGLAAAWMVLAGAAMLAAYVIGDRSRGRKRCPRCWYDMGGAAGLTCPECGRAATSEAGLLRTRRRRRLLVIAAALVLAAGPIWIAPAVRDGTWAQRVPTTALIWYFPHMSERGGALTTELHDRISFGITGEMPPWQRRWLARQGVRALVARGARNRSVTALYALYYVREEAEQFMPLLAEMLLDPRATPNQPWYGSVVFGWHLPAEPLLKELMAALESDDEATRLRALGVIAAFGNAPRGEVAAPATLLDYARQESDLTLKTAAIDCLMAFREYDAVREILSGATQSDDHRLRLWAVLMLSEIDPYGGSSILARVHGTDDPSPQVRGAAARMVAAHGPYSEEMRAAILRIAAEPEGGAVLGALVQSNADLEFKRDTLLAALDRHDSLRSALFAVSLWTGDRSPFLPKLQTLHRAALDRGDADEAAYLENLMSNADTAPGDK